MKFSYNWLKELTGIKESPRHLAEFLTLRAFEVEAVVKKGRDFALDIKLFPNRMDAAGHAGMAREIAALKNLELRIKNLELRENKSQKTSDVLRVKIQNPRDCPRYTARVMTGIKVGSSPKWMAERLEVCGLQSINNIVDAANYVMLEMGQPLHVFDFDTLSNPSRISSNVSLIRSQRRFEINSSSFAENLRKFILVRRARKGEKLLALDEKTYSLSSEILVIADEKEPIAIAGIKGGKESGVSAKTRNIVIESANFDPVRTRIASRLLNLKTDASWRFERGMDPNQTAPAVDRLAELIHKLGGGEILNGRADAYPRPLRPNTILLRPDYARRLVGEDIPRVFYEAAFRRLGWSYVKRANGYALRPPTERRDIQIEEDIIEEIVRRWGYEKIRPVPPKTHLLPAAANEERGFENGVKDILVGAGFTEVYAYAFASKKVLDDFNTSADGLLELENPVSPATQYLGAHPAQQLLETTAENLRRHERVAIFGISKGFKPTKNPKPEAPADERKYLVIARAAKAGKDAESFYAVKGALDQLLESLGIADHWYDDALTKDKRLKTKALHPYRTAKIMSGDKFLGIVAELHPAVQQKLKAKARLVFAELDFEKLWKLAQSEAEFRPIGKYPAVIRDIAVVVPENVKADDVEGLIQNAGRGLLIDSDLFDYFQDEAMTEAKQKSLAFHLIFQSPARTLTDGEVNKLFKKIVAAVKQKDWGVRE